MKGSALQAVLSNTPETEPYEAEDLKGMWKNALEMPEPEWQDPTVILEIDKKRKNPLQVLMQWLIQHWAWIVLWVVCILGTVIVNHFENRIRIHDAIGGEAVLMFIPVIVWIVAKEE